MRKALSIRRATSTPALLNDAARLVEVQTADGPEGANLASRAEIGLRVYSNRKRFVCYWLAAIKVYAMGAEKCANQPVVRLL
jgi:hypothetical protein